MGRGEWFIFKEEGMKKMSLIYDPSANNKPANADTLFLNNEGFKQEQININNNESTLKLDISALLSQGEIEGTECVGLLIEQWRTVASICDTFRNFGTGVLDPTLGKMLKSFYIIDDDAAKSTESNLLSENKREYDSLPTNPFDDYGLYGGYQVSIDPAHSVLGSNWIIGEDDDIYDFVKKHKGYENYSDKQIHDLLTTLEKTGCSYVAVANAIFWQYRNHGDIFEEKFGFPIRGKDGDLNYKKLIIEYYLNTRCTIFLDEPHGKEAFIEYFLMHPDEYKKRFGEYCAVDPEGKNIDEQQILFEETYNRIFFENGQKIFHTQNDNKADYSISNKLSHYSKEKNLGLVCKYYKRAEVTEKKIKEALMAGHCVKIGVTNYKLEYEDGSDYSEKSNGGHAMIVTGIAPDGRYIVSSWGEKLYLDPKDAESITALIIKQNPKKVPGGATLDKIVRDINMQTENIENVDSAAAIASGLLRSKVPRPGMGRVTKASDFNVPLKNKRK